MVYPAAIFMLVGLIYWVLCAGLDQVLKGVAARVRTQ